MRLLEALGMIRDDLSEGKVERITPNTVDMKPVDLFFNPSPAQYKKLLSQAGDDVSDIRGLVLNPKMIVLWAAEYLTHGQVMNETGLHGYPFIIVDGTPEPTDYDPEMFNFEDDILDTHPALLRLSGIRESLVEDYDLIRKPANLRILVRKLAYDISGSAGSTDMYEETYREETGKEPQGRGWEKWYREKLEDAIRSSYSEIEWRIKNGWIDVWRMIEVSPKWNPISYPLGLYWSYDKKSAEAHWGKGGKKALIHARAHKSQINWEATIIQNANPDYKDSEKEIRINRGGWVDLVQVDLGTSPVAVKPGRYPVGNGEYVGETC